MRRPSLREKGMHWYTLFTNTLSHLSAPHTKYTSLPTPLPCHKHTVSHGPPLAAVHIVPMEADSLPGGRNEQSCPAEMPHSACMRPSAVHHHCNWPKRSNTAWRTKQKSSTFTSSLNLLLRCSEVVAECFTLPWKEITVICYLNTSKNLTCWLNRLQQNKPAVYGRCLVVNPNRIPKWSSM